MADLCKKGFELLQELKSCDDETLPMYNEELVERVLAECKEHEQGLTAITSAVTAAERQRLQLGPEDPAPQLNWGDYKPESVGFIVHYESIKRNKRLLMAYMFERFERMKHLKWTRGQLPAEAEERMSPAEVNLFKAYDRALDKYMRPVTGVGKDLTTDLLPPNNPDLKVRVLQDVGAVDITRGRVCLKKGSIHFLPREEAEPLIRQGILTTDITF